MRKIRDLMDKGFARVKPSSSIVEIAKTMKEYATGTVFVCDNGKLLGIVDQGHIISKIVAANRDPNRESAVSLMSNHTPKASPGIDVTEAAKLMARHSISVLPVVEHGKTLGVVTIDDLIKESPALALMVMIRQIEAFEVKDKATVAKWQGKPSVEPVGKA